MKRDVPGPGQESVWDYPRPPALRKVERPVKIVFDGRVLAETTNAWSVHETSHPPVYYIPLEDVDDALIERVDGSSYCEWKGSASYVDVGSGGASVGDSFVSLLSTVSFFRAVDAAEAGEGSEGRSFFSSAAIGAPSTPRLIMSRSACVFWRPVKSALSGLRSATGSVDGR